MGISTSIFHGDSKKEQEPVYAPLHPRVPTGSTQTHTPTRPCAFAPLNASNPSLSTDLVNAVIYNYPR